jgi:integrase
MIRHEVQVRMGPHRVRTLGANHLLRIGGDMTRGFKLTQRSVETITCPPGKKDVLVFDSSLRGFGLRVTTTGGKTFLAQYNAAGGKRRVALGTFGVLTVEQARKAAQGVLGEAAKGTDPFAARKAAARAARAAKAEAEYTFEAMVTAWSNAREGDRRPSYLREAVACLGRNLPQWKNRAAGSITLAEAVRALDAIKAAKGTVAANRTLAYGRAAYGWAFKRQHVSGNPLRGIERPGKEMARERVLDAGELGAIWRACDELGPTLAGFVRVLMLTLQRRAEVASMQWSELDSLADPAVWTLPGDRAKNGRTHVIHLSDPVREIVRGMPKVNGNLFVFAGRDGKPIAAFNYAKAEIQTALSDAGIVMPDWRFHDFRRAGVTMLATMGFAPHVCDRILNHITGTITGVAAIYQRSEFLNERKAALDAWAAAVLRVAEGTAAKGNVVALRRA